MKKLFLFALMCLMTVSMNAQRCAVMEFKAGAGISQADVDGISAIFITYFRPAGYTMVERTQIDRVIDEQGFQRGRLTESQMVRIGQILNVSKIVVGDVNIAMGQYNVDVRAINVESGTIAATKGATFSGSSYRASMQSLAQSLASSIAITSGGTVSSSSQQQRNEPYVIYGYLKVFPTDLGTFKSEPKTVIERLNQAMQYGYGTWRLPTNEELALMRANNIVGSGEYMTFEDEGGIVRLVTDKEKGDKCPCIPQGYVDLGLPSHTLWKDKVEGLYTYDQAIEKFENHLPTTEQLKELKELCQWFWLGYERAFKVIGPNGQTLMVPVQKAYDYYSFGVFWSSESGGMDKAWALEFYSPSTDNSEFNKTSTDVDRYIESKNRTNEYFVRLVR